MKIFKTVFLFTVGVMAIAFEELDKSFEEAAKSMEEQRKKVNERFPKQHA